MFKTKKFISIFSLSIVLLTTGLDNPLAVSQEITLDKQIFQMEKNLEKEYETYFGKDLAEVNQTSEQMAKTLARLSRETQTRSALIWVMPKDNYLRLVLINPDGEPIFRHIEGVSLSILQDTVKKLHQEINKVSYPIDLTNAQKLYQWIIKPLEEEYLKPNQIDTILFCMGNGLRGLPIAALHDGNQYLVEKYALSIIPAFNLINKQYQRMENPSILAMGASEFKEQRDLPAVPLEISYIVQKIVEASKIQQPLKAKQFLNSKFTIENLELELSFAPFDIVHLATHARFMPGIPRNSYIQFWDGKLTLENMNKFNQNDHPPELLVLSACQTAVGDSSAELGFAGVALNSGVKSALASLWYISDAGTLALMAEFYQQLLSTTTKAQALQQAQINLIKEKVYFEGNQLSISDEKVTLPNTIPHQGKTNLSHPFYWAGFTLISSPW